MRAQGGDIVPQRSGEGSRADPAMRRPQPAQLICGAANDPEHAVGKPADHDRHFAGFTVDVPSSRLKWPK